MFYAFQHGYSPLYVACQMGHKVIISVLLENGADVHLATVSTLSVSPSTVVLGI